MLTVYLEEGSKRTFACAYDWPGWCRSGKTEAAALESLVAYAPRYAVVAADAGFELSPADLSPEIVERVKGSGTTDFGAPGHPAARDSDPLAPGEAERLAELVAASWRALDRAASRAPAELAKGPRGGGRDRDKVLQHVLAAETSYARNIGVRHREPQFDDRAAITALHDDILRVIRSAQSAREDGRGWLLRYAVRRIAWHVLDHAWEIEDRGGLEPERAW